MANNTIKKQDNLPEGFVLEDTPTGFDLERPPIGLPKERKVENLISGRQDLLSATIPRAEKEIGAAMQSGGRGGLSLGTLLGATGGAGQRIESAIANPLLGLQKGETNLAKLGKEAFRGIKG
ncbi:unnamed protein product, partial [marine sediment metagenome]